jgi:hypothetical protein
LATFELIRGLYDDQNPSQPLPLRYRGIPTYPSEAAYRLFSAFFIPQIAGGGDPFPVFMEALRQAQLDLIKDNRARFGGDSRPMDWGAWVLSGDRR